MAMIAVVEKLGYEKETEDVVLEQLNSDRVGMLNIVGTKALMSVMKEKPFSTDEIMKQFQPDDFQHDSARKSFKNSQCGKSSQSKGSEKGLSN